MTCKADGLDHNTTDLQDVRWEFKSLGFNIWFQFQREDWYDFDGSWQKPNGLKSPSGMVGKWTWWVYSLYHHKVCLREAMLRSHECDP